MKFVFSHTLLLLLFPIVTSAFAPPASALNAAEGESPIRSANESYASSCLGQCAYETDPKTDLFSDSRPHDKIRSKVTSILYGNENTKTKINKSGQEQ